MEYEINFIDDAEEDLDNLIYFITYIRRLEEYAKRVKFKISFEINRLSNLPEMYQATGIRDREGHEYRKMVVDKRYIVLYYIDYDDRVVYIAHIYDGRSNYIRKLV